MNAHSAIHVRQLTLSLLLILLLFDQSLAQGPMITDAVLDPVEKRDFLPSSDLLPSADELSDRQSKIELQIKSLDLTIRSLEDSSTNAWLLESYNTELAQLKYLNLVYHQHWLLLVNRHESDTAHGNIDAELERIYDRLVAASEFSSFSEVERIRNGVQVQQSRIKTLEAEIESGRALKISTATRLNEFERTRRHLQETYDSSNGSKESVRIARQLVTTQLSVAICKASISKMIFENENGKRELEVCSGRLAILEKMLDAMPSTLVFSQEVLDEQLARIAQQERELQQRLVQTQQDFQSLDAQFHQTIEDEELSDIAHTEILAIFEYLRESNRLRTSYLNASLSEQFELQSCWNTRFEIARKRLTDEERIAAAESLEQFSARLTNEKRLVGMHLDEARGTQTALTIRIKNEGDSGTPLAKWLKRHAQGVEQLFHAANERLVQVKAAEQLLFRVDAELQQQVSARAGKPSWIGLGKTISAWWDYELFAVDDRPITLGKLLTALLMLIVGLFISHRTSQVIGSKAFRHFGAQNRGPQALQTILFYSLCLVFGFFTLEWLNIPLTVFAFLGGAAAIAVGFGSQTLLNNFISGLIMMGERPVRVGDLVEIDGVQGNITHIGARSTKLLTGENLEIIVPNAKFMEQRLINWTLSSTQIRTEISVGVAYGSPTEQVVKLLESALDGCPVVDASRKPVVLFSDFGSDALQFEIHFWIHMRQLMDARKAESDVRRKIDEVLRANDITVAFPQRDVHVDLKDPIQISLKEPTPSSFPTSTGNSSVNRAA